MSEIKRTIAKNIVQLRRAKGMTQLELAEQLNYSDKAVSKWERGESLPDIIVLKEIADLFQVKVDDLLTVGEEDELLPREPEERSFRNKGFVTGMSILLVWLIATLIYVLIEMIRPDFHNHWLAFIYAVPVSLIVWLVLNSIWFNRRINFLIISLLMWSVLATAFITPLPYGFNAWLIFVVGIPGQAIILLWSRIQRKKKA